MKHYKAFFANISSFKNKSGLLPSVSITISMSNQTTTGAKLEAIISKINTSFSRCDFMICDTLNRFNLLALNPSLNISKAKDLAFEEGSRWLEDNQVALSKLSIPYQLFRWDNWLQHENFMLKLKLIEQELRNNVLYHQALEATAEAYLKRQNIIIDKNKTLNLCIDYLKEECAVMLLWAEEGYNFEAYPAKRNLAMAKTFDIFIKSKFSKLVLLPIKIYVKPTLLSERK